MSDLVRCEVDGEVWRLRMARPPVNALDLALLEALAARFEEAGRDASCRAVVLCGAPGVFSAGIDTKQVPALSPVARTGMIRALNRTVLSLYALPKPTVAAVSGHALGGGLVLALACDGRLAARGAFRLGLLEVAAGIPFPAAPLAVTRAELPADALRRLALTGAVLGPEAPELAAVIDAVVAPEALEPAATARARELAALPAFAAVKAQLRRDTLAQLRRVVADDADPILRGRWLQS